MLGTDEIVLQSLGFLLSGLEHAPEALRDVDLLSRRSRPSEAVESRIQALADLRGRDAELIKNRRHDAVLLNNQRGQQMFGFHLRVLATLRHPLGLDHRLLGFLRQLVEVHCSALASEGIPIPTSTSAWGAFASSQAMRSSSSVGLARCHRSSACLAAVTCSSRASILAWTSLTRPLSPVKATRRCSR